jgi:hypothetical protein
VQRAAWLFLNHHPIPRRDTISRPIDRISSMAGGEAKWLFSYEINVTIHFSINESKMLIFYPFYFRRKYIRKMIKLTPLTDVMILKIFLLQLLLVFVKFDRNIGFSEKTPIISTKIGKNHIKF